MERRRFLCISAAALARAQSGEPQTWVYKKAGSCEIKADVFAAPGPGPHPVAVWIHGGALIAGSRKLAPGARVLRTLREAGFGVISIDYRLAPETKLPGILEDVEDAFTWLRSHAIDLRADPARVAVCGASAGGYLTLMTGIRIQPRPKALVSYWGYGEIASAWYAKPDAFYRRQPLVSREEALAAVGSEPLSEQPAKHDRYRFYLYCRQQGLWPREVAGRDPERDPRWFDAFCPLRKVTNEFPPTMLVHGTADTDVPYEQSALMADRLRVAGVEHRLVTVPDGAHGLGNLPAEEQEKIYRDAATFLRDRV